MGASQGATGVITQRTPPDIRLIKGGATNVWCLTGVFERGPIGEFKLCTDYSKVKELYGDYLASYHSNISLERAFKGKGNKRIWVNRIAHMTDPDDKTTKTSVASTITHQTAASAPTSGYVLGTIAQPFDIEPGDTIRVVTDAVDTTCTYTATAASRENGVDEVFALADSQTLTVKIDEDLGGGLQTITFLTGEFVDIGNATAEEVAAVIAAKIVGAQVSVTGAGKRVTITSDTRGNKSGVNVTGGTANAALQFTTGLVNGTGNVPDIDNVSGAEAIAVIVVAGVTPSVVGGCIKLTRDDTGPTKTVQVHAASTADDEMGLDNATHAGTDGAPVNTLKVTASSDGTWGDDLSALPAVATNKDATCFDYIVKYKARIVERHRNLKIGSANASDAMYCETVVNRDSKYIVVADQLCTLTPPTNLPAITELALAGGGDGLAGLVDADYLGDAGMKAVRFVNDNVMNVFMPDITSASGIAAVADYCKTKRMFYQPDVASGLDADGLVTFISGGGLAGYSELFDWAWPWHKIANPDKDVYGQADTIEVPASGGIVASFFTQDNKKGGVHEAPCGTDNGRMIDVVGLEGEVGNALHEVEDVDVRGYLMDNRINIIHRSHEGLFYLDNTDVAKGDGSFPSIGESRGALYIERAIDRALEWVPNRNITAKLYREIYDSIYVFLLGEMYNDAFYNQNPDEAFYINMSAAMNPPSERYAGRINIKIGLAKAGPCKWVYVTITKDVRALEQEILAGQS